ncbi:MAG: phosphate ABC transporter permease PstA [Actinomycetota bacterium]
MVAVTTELREQLRVRRSADTGGQVFRGLLTLALLISFAALVAVILTALTRSWPILSERAIDFLTSSSSQDPTKAGVFQGVQGSVLLAVITGAVAFPVGIGGAIYLEEYAGDTLFSRFLQVVVRNLAGVPSIVYGLLGLAVFVQALGGITGGRSVIAGGLTLACLVLPVVIITTQEAIRAVPSEQRQAGYGIGATHWEVIRSIVLPSAAPGILTGTVLSIARAVGEAAPILVVGAVSGFFQTGNLSFLEQMQSFFTALPMQIFSFTRQPTQTWGAHAAGASVAILLVVIALNSVAIWMRARLDRRLRK